MNILINSSFNNVKQISQSTICLTKAFYVNFVFTASFLLNQQRTKINKKE